MTFQEALEAVESLPEEQQERELRSAPRSSFDIMAHRPNQLELLPADVIERLTLTHHRALLPLPDPKSKEELARRALDEGWPSDVLAAEVSKLLPASRRGRRPSPPFVKTIRRVAKALDSSRVEDLDAEEIRRLGPEKTAAWAAQVKSRSAAWRASRKLSRRHGQRSGPTNPDGRRSVCFRTETDVTPNYRRFVHRR